MRQWAFLISLLPLWLAACAASPSGMMGSGMDGMMQRHMAPIPANYATLTNPVAADAESLARGQKIYAANCSVCHGEGGLGNGPAAANLDPRPAPIAQTAQMLSDAYLFYRVSEGGGFAPFNSAMPAWKGKLSGQDRWDVINYIHSLGGNTMMGGGMTHAPARSAGVDGGGMMGGGAGAWMWAWMILGWVLVIAILIAVVIAVVWAARRAGGGSRPAGSLLEILKQRYAQGEITSEQFEAMKRQLSGG